MLKFICDSCGMTASFEEFEYQQAVEEGDTPLACDCCGEGALVEEGRADMWRLVVVWSDGRVDGPAVFAGAEWFDFDNWLDARVEVVRLMVALRRIGFTSFTNDMLSHGTGAGFRAVEFAVLSAESGEAAV